MNKNLDYKLLSVCLIAGLISMLNGIAVSAEPVVTLKDMVEKTISSNPEVQARYHKFLEAGHEQDVMRAGLLPKADIVSSFREQEKLVKNINNTATPSMNNELVLRQMIFDGFAISSEVKRLGFASRVRYYELQSAMQNTTLEFMRAYIDILRYRELTQFAKDNYVIHKQLSDRIKDRVEAGVARRVDLEQANGRLALAEANLLTETTNLHDVTARFQRLYGDLPPAALEAPNFFNAGVEASAEDALKIAYRHNPDLLSTIEDIQAKRKEINTNEARYFPRLDLQARKNLGTSSDGKNSTSAADLLELTLNFNLFNGFSDKHSILQAAQKLNGAQDMRDKACIDTRQLVVIAYNDIVQLKEQRTYREQHRNSIENARVAYQKQFDIGQRTLLDLLDSENEFFQAKRSLTNTEYDLQMAYVRTYAGQGALLNKIGAARGNLPEYAREDYQDNESICQAIAPAQPVIDKEALLADAKPLANVYPTLAKPALAANEIKTEPTPAAFACKIEDVTARVHDWGTAWRQKDADQYLKFYADSFVPESSLDRGSWEKQRRERLSKHGKIGLKIEDLQVSCDGEKAIATFNQSYTLTQFKIKKTADTACEVCNMKRIPIIAYQDKVKKELQFEHVNNAWQIVRELTSK